MNRYALPAKLLAAKLKAMKRPIVAKGTLMAIERIHRHISAADMKKPASIKTSFIDPVSQRLEAASASKAA